MSITCQTYDNEKGIVIFGSRIRINKNNVLIPLGILSKMNRIAYKISTPVILTTCKIMYYLQSKQILWFLHTGSCYGSFDYFVYLFMVSRRKSWI